MSSSAWQRSGTAEFSARWGPSTGVIVADGELDAANADLLADFVHRCSEQRDRLVLDLRGLQFIGTAGFSALHRINVSCSEAHARWSMIPSPAVSRLLQLCDPDGTLPIMGTATEAPEGPDGLDAELLQLVAETR